MTKILFQGDSITDGMRTTIIQFFTRPGPPTLPEPDDLLTAMINSVLGTGYPAMIAGMLGERDPQQYEIVNRGVSGDRIIDLHARIKRDMINLKPDIISILIGVNDVWHDIMFNNGVSAGKFETLYKMLLDEIRAELPGSRIVVIEPFVLQGSATIEKWEVFYNETLYRRQIVSKIADMYSLTLVRVQKAFDEAIIRAPASWWSPDGIHPSAAGHMLIAKEWMMAFDGIESEE